MVAPARFLPMAEELGLIRPIGQWVLRTGLEDAERWRQAGGAFGRLSVNLSFCQFRQRDLHRKIADLLAGSGLPPGMLELELTESMLAQDPERAVEMVRELHGLGVGLAIDDFGTGYSSLSYLQQFHVGRLKIDKSFLLNASSAADSDEIIRTVISLARHLGLEVVAEGAETAHHVERLNALSCDMAQGR